MALNSKSPWSLNYKITEFENKSKYRSIGQVQLKRNQISSCAGLSELKTNSRLHTQLNNYQAQAHKVEGHYEPLS